MNKIHDYQFIKKINGLPFVEKVILYGSRACGLARPLSDIDLAIQMKPCSSQTDWQQVCDLIDEADTLLEIDYVRLDALSDEDPLKTNILTTGKEIQ